MEIDPLHLFWGSEIKPFNPKNKSILNLLNDREFDIRYEYLQFILRRRIITATPTVDERS